MAGRKALVQAPADFAEARCLCGMCKLRFLQTLPLLHVHCCCADCRQGRQWAASMGGPPIRQAVTMVTYFANDLVPLAPEALSRLYRVKLRDDGKTTRLITSCCHSILAIDHPYYDGNVVCVHSDACDLVSRRIAPLGRIFSDGWDAEEDGEMPPSTAMLEDSDAMWARFATVIKSPVRNAQGVRLQDIFAQLPPVTILGLARKGR